MERRCKPKFRVIDIESGEEVKNCFVLFPDYDQAAVYAIEEYARKTVNAGMANILEIWAKRIRERSRNPNAKQFTFTPSREEL